MKGGWLEHEIRSLPQVLACSVNTDEVVVLIQASAEPAAVEQAVKAVLLRAGTEVPVRVFGGARPMFVEPIPIRSGRNALVGTFGGAAILAVGVWLAGATAGLRSSPKSKAPVTLLAPPCATEIYTIPAVPAPDGPLIPQEITFPTPLLRPVRLARAGGTHAPPAARPGKTVHLQPPSPPPPPNPRPDRSPHDEEDAKPKHGRGKGPPAWSHSIHVPAHDEHGRPR